MRLILLSIDPLFVSCDEYGIRIEYPVTDSQLLLKIIESAVTAVCHYPNTTPKSWNRRLPILCLYNIHNVARVHKEKRASNCTIYACLQTPLSKYKVRLYMYV